MKKQLPDGILRAHGPQGQRAMSTGYRAIPSIEQLRQRPALRALEHRYGRHAIVAALRAEADGVRAQLAGGATAEELGHGADWVAEQLERRVEARLRELFAGSLRRVVNATGIIVHTNLGRAPLSEEAIARLSETARGYSNLEFDLATGTRG